MLPPVSRLDLSKVFQSFASRQAECATDPREGLSENQL